MSAAKNLLRLHQWMLDERRQKLADLEGLAERLTQEIELLDRRLSESEALDAEERAVAEARRDKLQRTLDGITTEIERARQDLGETLREIEDLQASQKARPDLVVQRGLKREPPVRRALEPSIYRKQQNRRRG